MDSTKKEGNTASGVPAPAAPGNGGDTNTTDSLESGKGASTSSEQVTITTEKGAKAGDKPPVQRTGTVGRLVTHLNIYLVAFVLLIVVTGASGAIFYVRQNNQASKENTLSSQSLSQATLDQLANNDVTVGEPQHTLNVQSNAIFTGSVLVRKDLQIAGGLQVGTGTAINGIRVSGVSKFDDVQIAKSLSLNGTGSIQGQLTIQGSLNVNGTGTFQGPLSAPQVTVGSLQLNGNLNLTHHITAGGSTPSRSNGTALGSGGTVSISGSDTAGSVSINTGSGPGPGCFITVHFTTAFNGTPHIVLTPVGSAAGGLNFYITRSTTEFSICTTNSPPGGSSFGFDYIAFD